MDKTKIEIAKGTANKLKHQMKVGDTYDSVIRRLIENERIHEDSVHD